MLPSPSSACCSGHSHNRGVARLAFISTASLTAICLVIPFRLLCSSRLMPSQLCCAVCSWRGWLKKASQVIVPCASGENLLLLGLMSAGFCILTLSARWSAMYGHSSLPLMVLGLAVMGFAELFIDPVAMSQITRIEIPGVTGVLTGIYMRFPARLRTIWRA